MDTMKDALELANGVNRVMVGLSVRLEDWLSRPETREAIDRAARGLQTIFDGVNHAVRASAERYTSTVADEKRQLLAAAQMAPNGLHKADVPGLLSLGAPAELIARAEVGGPARPRVRPYQEPSERFRVRFGAFAILMQPDPLTDAAERRQAIELLPYRDRYVHAVVCGEVERARSAGLRGEDARTKAFKEASWALSQHTTKRPSQTAVMRTYRHVEALAKGDRDGVVLPAMTADDFILWIEEGRVPCWLKG